LFYRDLDDKINQIIINPEYKEAIDEIRNLWKDQVNFYDNSEETEKFIRKRNRTNEENKKKGLKRRKIKNWVNNHIPSFISSNITNINNNGNKNDVQMP
jgi:hypothetical protein